MMFLSQLTKEELKGLIKEALKEEFQNQIQHLNNDAEEVLTVVEACEFLKISKPTLNKHLATGIVQSLKIGGRRLFMKSELIESLKEVQNEK